MRQTVAVGVIKSVTVKTADSKKGGAAAKPGAAAAKAPAKGGKK
jgi:hypothetical protein